MNSPSTENAAPANAGISPLPEEQADAKGVPPVRPPALPEEVDVWWGSFASRTMLPSFLVCLVATALIAWLTWALLPGHLMKLAFLCLAGTVWVFQGIRWGYRYFGYHYRLTNQRLFCHRGFVYTPLDQVELAEVARVLVQCNWWDRLLGVGQVLVQTDDPNREALIMEGVCKPARIAENIRVHVKEARAQRETAGKTADPVASDKEGRAAS
jgi:hypothetical protein